MENDVNKKMKKIDIVRIEMIKEKRENFSVNSIKNPDDAAKVATEFLQNYDREAFIVLSLDVKNKINNISVVSVGCLNSSIVHPREVFKSLILSNASSFIVAHNHPSGDSTPSNEDKIVTGRLKSAGKIFGIELLDHIIVGDGEYTSLNEEGIL